MTWATRKLPIISGFALALAISLPSAAAKTAAPITCGTIYQVERGDSLHSIAMRAYGQGKYPAIYLANRDVLPDKSSIFVGVRLLVPCLDGTGPRTRAEARAMGMLDTPAARSKFIAAPKGTATAPKVTAPAPEADGSVPVASAAAVVADAPGIGLLSGPDFAPFADPSLPEGGMIAELVTLALAQAAPDRPARLSFVNDWSRHLALLNSGEFDVGFPWYKPDCSRADRLSGSMKARCNGFIFSAPLFEVDMGFYVRAGDPLEAAAAPEDLYGKRLCRPAGYFTFDLEQDGLFEPNLTRVIPPGAADCFTWLARGEVDVVSLSTQMAAGEISRLGLDGRVASIPALASAQTLHVVAPENSAEGRADIELINKGLAELQMSGRWFEVVSRHLGAYGLSMR